MNTVLKNIKKSGGRADGRLADQMRPVSIIPHVFPYALGSVLFSIGNTRVLCAVTINDGVPKFLRNTGSGWLTAEYALMPASTLTRTQRELPRSERSIEISRLIGRSLRAVVNLKQLGERTLTIDCDVLQADGGTRAAAITGAFYALNLAQQELLLLEKIKEPFIKHDLAAISAGIINGQPYLDLNYQEDSQVQADFNFVLTRDGGIIEIQGTAEQAPVLPEQFGALHACAQQGITELLKVLDECHVNARRHQFSFAAESQ